MAKKINGVESLNRETKTPTKNVGAVSRERNIKDNRRKKGNGLLTFFLMLVLVGVGIGILLSPSFNLTEVVVVDGVNVNSAEILNKLNVNYGENIFKQDYNAIKEAVSSIPYIADVNLSLKLPDKIEIKYSEREPYIAIGYLSSFIVADKYGYLLEVMKENERGLPVLTGLDIENYELGKKLSDTARIKYENSVILLESAIKQDFSYHIYEINYDVVNELKLFLKDSDIVIVFGEFERDLVQDKLLYLEKALSVLKGEKGELDISSENYLEKVIFSRDF